MIITSGAEIGLREFDQFSQGVLSRTRSGGDFTQDGNFVPPWVHCTKQLFPPFTYLGGKRDIASEVWRRFGWDIPNYIEPFAGGLSVLLARPVFDLRNLKKYRELVNDSNIFLINFWRTVKQENIEDLIESMDFPAHEEELLSRREEMMLRGRELAKTIRNVKAFDPELAAYWLYVQRQWIGGSADDPTTVPDIKMVRAKESGHLGSSIGEHLRFIQARTRHTRFFSGDWKRPLISPTQTTKFKGVGVFMDPPYIDTTGYYSGRYDSNRPSNRVPLEARAWALEHGQNPRFRIAYCGYLHHHDHVFPVGGRDGWIRLPWKKKNGYSKPGENKPVEIDTVWFSPHCNRFEDDPK